MTINTFLPTSSLLPKRYLHVGFNFVGQPITEELQTVFNSMSLDWLKYSGNCWITYTQYDAVTWFNALKLHIKDADSILILELKQPQIAQGWLPPWAWEWLNKVRS